MRRLLLLLFLFMLSLSACVNKKFDRKEWDYGDGIEYPNRDKMLDDLLKNHPLKGLKYAKVIGLLNHPQGKDSSSIYYEIKLNIDKNTKHISRKELVIEFTRDSVVSKVEVKDTK